VDEAVAVDVDRVQFDAERRLEPALEPRGDGLQPVGGGVGQIVQRDDELVDVGLDRLDVDAGALVEVPRVRVRVQRHVGLPGDPIGGGRDEVGDDAGPPLGPLVGVARLEALLTDRTVTVLRARKSHVVQTEVGGDGRRLGDCLKQPLAVLLAARADVVPIEVLSLPRRPLAVLAHRHQRGIVLRGPVVAEAGDHADPRRYGVVPPPRHVFHLVERGVEFRGGEFVLVSRDHAVHTSPVVPHGHNGSWIAIQCSTVVERGGTGRCDPHRPRHVENYTPYFNYNIYYIIGRGRGSATPIRRCQSPLFVEPPVGLHAPRSGSVPHRSASLGPLSAGLRVEPVGSAVRFRTAPVGSERRRPISYPGRSSSGHLPAVRDGCDATDTY
jgi:hypothetical protein